jgi:nucleoside-diphosphate-sugar epimerase
MKCMVFGDTGTIGSALVDELTNQGHDVLGCSRSIKHGYNHEVVDLVTYGLDEIKEVIDDFGPEIIYHFAANPLVKDGTYLSTEANILSTHKLLDATPPNCKFVFASSATVYGKHSTIRTVDSEINPSSVYALGKSFCEKLIEFYKNQNKIKEYIIFRYVAHVGYYGTTHGLVFDIINKLLSNTTYLELYGPCPGTKKQFLSIKDSIHTTVKYSFTKNGVYNISPKSSLSVLEVADIIKNELNIHKPIIWTDNTWFGDDNYVNVESNFPNIKDSKDAIIEVCKSVNNAT